MEVGQERLEQKADINNGIAVSWSPIKWPLDGIRELVNSPGEQMPSKEILIEQLVEGEERREKNVNTRGVLLLLLLASRRNRPLAEDPHVCEKMSESCGRHTFSAWRASAGGVGPSHSSSWA